MYPKSYKRGYSSFADGFTKAASEGALMRGAVANSLKMVVMMSSMTSIHDWCKENSYYTLGPHWLNRFWATAVASAIGTFGIMSLETIRIR